MSHFIKQFQPVIIKYIVIVGINYILRVRLS